MSPENEPFQIRCKNGAKVEVRPCEYLDEPAYDLRVLDRFNRELGRWMWTATDVEQVATVIKALEAGRRRIPRPKDALPVKVGRR